VSQGLRRKFTIEFKYLNSYYKNAHHGKGRIVRGKAQSVKERKTILQIAKIAENK